MFTDYKELETYCRESGIRMIDFKIVDLGGRWRHLTIPISKLSPQVVENGVGFDGSNYGYAKVEKSDMAFVPDLSTSHIDIFCPTPTLSMICDLYILGESTNSRYDADPRFICRKAEEYVGSTGVATEPVIGPEFEFYLFDHISYTNEPQRTAVRIDSYQGSWNTGEREDQNFGYKIPDQKGYHASLPHDINFELRNKMVLALEDAGVKVKYHHHEVGGPGQVEIETAPGGLCEMADKTMLLKYIVKNIALQHGKTATFMPKPLYGHAGSGMHVHIWLFKEGKAVFYDPAGYAQLSETALYFIGGLLKHARSLVAFTNASTNSYKRLVPGYEAPVSVCFASANRTAVVRIPAYAKEPKDKRFEFRPSDAMCNPYLAYAALLMAGMDGIAAKIDPVAEGYGPFDVNLYTLSNEEKRKIGSLPRSLHEAADALEEDFEYLLAGGVFDRLLIESHLKRIRNESLAVDIIPHPEEFRLYYDL